MRNFTSNLESTENSERYGTPVGQKTRRRRRGATLVEFAFIAPVIFAFIFGFFEFGRLLMVQHALANSAREGARHASLASTLSTATGDVDTLVRDSLSAVIPNSSDTSVVRINVNMAGVTSGSDVSVRVEVTYSDITWLPGSFLGLNQNGRLVAEQHLERE